MIPKIDLTGDTDGQLLSVGFHTLPQTLLGGSLFTDGQVHVNDIESFWSYTKRRLARFNGVKVNFSKITQVSPSPA